MKAIEWQKYLESQARDHEKYIYTVTELANVAGTSRHALNVELARLRKYGLIEQYSHGRYGLPGRVTPEILLPNLDNRAYITGGYALFFHQLITQFPEKITCFTDRRHGQSRKRSTPIGAFVFTCVKKSIYAPPRDGVIADPEQAFCDFIYLMRRDGADPESLVTFRNLEKIRTQRLNQLLPNYPRTVRKQAEKILSRV